MLSTCQPVAPRNVSTWTGPSTPAHATHATAPATPTAANAASARHERSERAPRTSGDEQRNERERPHLGEARERDRRTPGDGLRAPEQCEPTDRERDREQVEPEVEERVPREREPEDEVGQRGAAAPPPCQEQRDEGVERHLAAHDPLGRLPHRAAVEGIDRGEGQRRVLDREVRVWGAAPRGDPAVAADVAGKTGVTPGRGVPVEHDADRDDAHREQRDATPGNGPNPRRHALIGVPSGR
jgi:hypothetical protein